MTAIPSLPPADLRRLSDYLAWYGRERPDSEAIVTGDERLSYKQLEVAVQECAGALLSCGVGRSDRVAMLSTPGGAYWVSFLATAAIGAIWCGLNPRHTPEELDRVIARVEPRLVFARTQIEERSYAQWIDALPESMQRVCLQQAGARALQDFTQIHRAEHARLHAALRAVEPDDICLIVFTSGSSGQPKGVTIKHAALVGASRVQLEQWPASPLRVLNNLPINHIGATGDLGCYALIGGGTSVFCERFSPEESLRLIEKESVTVLGQVPTQFELTLKSSSFRAEALGSIQLLFWGGAPASADLVRRLAALGKPIATSYGQTETVGSVTFTRGDTPLERLALTVGVPVTPYEVRIGDESGGEQPTGVGGEVLVRSPFLMSGYWRAPEATAAAFTSDGWLRTGDVGTLSPDHELTLIGRTSEVFKSGGYNIYPAEIEAALLACAGVWQAAVISTPDALYGAVGLAAVVPKAGTSLSPERVRTELQRRLANYKIPKRIRIIESLPRLPVGKVDKTALRKLLVESEALPDAGVDGGAAAP